MAVPAHERGAPSPEPIRRMVEALEAEITAVQRRENSRWRWIGRGSRRAARRHQVYYDFERGGGLGLSVGRRVRLDVGEGAETARVAAVGADRLTLACDTDHGPETGSARIRRDGSGLLRAARNALRRSTLPRPASLLFEPEAARRETDPGVAALPEIVDGLNAAQRVAVESSVRSELSYLWGPPGTGKTHTLAHIVEALRTGDRSVLLVAPTNRAVDHLLGAVAARLEGTEALREGRVLRLGPIDGGELERRYGDLVGLEHWVEREAGTAELEARAAAVVRTLACRPSPDGDLPEDLETRAELDRRLGGDLRRLRTQLSDRAAEEDEIRRRLLRGADVVATTLHRAYLPGPLDRFFDVVVVDESSAAVLPTLVLAATRARRQLVIAGDFRQLPPVVKTRDREARKWLARDAFRVGGLVNAIRRGQAPDVLHRLTTQYRMRAEICALVGAFAYGGNLQTAPERSRSLPDAALPFDGDPLVLIDTAGFGAVLDPGSGASAQARRPKRSNGWHRLVIDRMLEDLLGGGGREGVEMEVAVLTPYRDQVDHLREAFGTRDSITISTVHRAQGREYDVVILDLPEAANVRPSPFVRARTLSQAGTRLLNVAASRAREQLVVVADCAYFDAPRLHGSAVGKFLVRLKETGRDVDGRAVVRSLSTAG